MQQYSAKKQMDRAISKNGQSLIGPNGQGIPKNIKILSGEKILLEERIFFRENDSFREKMF